MSQASPDNPLVSDNSLGSENPLGSSRPLADAVTGNPSPENARKGPLLEDVVFEELKALLTSQNRPKSDIEQVSRAFEYGRKYHEGQYRKNGDNYISHPVSVALFLANIPMDTATVTAAILHDVIEDTDATEEELASLFGDEVLKMVEGVTKLGKLKFASKEDQQAENFRKMFLAMADDVRVVLLKLADRLHNMQTLCYMKPEKQVKIATETIEIFAPLANRMGMGKLRAELEDLSLKYVDPEQYGIIDEEVKHAQSQWEKTIEFVMGKVQSQMKQMGIEARIYGRVKNYYSIYRKMLKRQKSVQEIYDLSALRIIVNSEKECYEVLGAIHYAFTPIPGRFKDYIAMPKSNLYRSLHTTVIGPLGQPLEVQIRTHEMHRIAEYGIAAHWKYKEAGSSEKFSANLDDQKLAWLRKMVEMKEETGDAREYVDSVKLDLFRDEVFVFTPKGKVIALPREATPVDFAYRIHSEIGNSCIGAMVNGKIVPLNYVLKNGDIVEVNTSKKSAPRLDWLHFVQTHQAKNHIRGWFKKHYREEHEEQGKRLLEETLTRAVFDEVSKSGQMLEIAKDLKYETPSDLFVALGYGELNIQRVTNRIHVQRGKLPSKPQGKTGASDSSLGENTGDGSLAMAQLERIKQFSKRKHTGDDIQGLEGMLYHLAKCCNPLPGEAIIGVVTRSRGVMVHREDCTNLEQANEERLMALSWGANATATQNRTQSIKLEVHVIDRMGVLKDILGKIADLRTNISNTKIQILSDQTALIEVTVDIQNLQHLDRVREAILQINDVLTVKRYQTTQLPGHQHPRK
ncbi:MAG: bifunctional (p)ppGpp synthetase/guanosine-3',5'-bis(diphosphate) 3'-pyrophosphohydrolase [Vampirovibrionales bacterium]|nr:bifunctional (p)ppGpp synthetase/guanosine-3',5'-bis(diphosphate) 3'-pyrophosphohydrolase [Vampirovibrionales bacterium]